MSGARNVLFLTALYFVQGLPFGYQSHTLPLLLREGGMPLWGIGLLSLLALPWWLKVLWSPLVDRYGRRKSWVVPLQGGLALACLAAAVVPIGPLLALVLLMNLFAATQDVAVDGWAVDLLGARQLGMGNAAQVVGYKLGMTVAGGFFLWLLPIRLHFPVMAALMAAVMLMTLGAPEPPRAPERPATVREIVAALLAALKRADTIWLLALVASYKLGESMIDVTFPIFLFDGGFEKSWLGRIRGVYGMGASIAGSLAGGVLATILPLRRAVLWAALVRVLPLAAIWCLAHAGPTPRAVIGVVLAENFFGGALTTVTFALMMSRVDRRIGATHFTLLATVEVGGKSLAGIAGGLVANGLGYAATFATGTLASVAFVGLVVAIPRPRASPR